MLTTPAKTDVLFILCVLILFSRRASPRRLAYGFLRHRRAGMAFCMFWGLLIAADWATYLSFNRCRWLLPTCRTTICCRWLLLNVCVRHLLRNSLALAPALCHVLDAALRGHITALRHE